MTGQTDQTGRDRRRHVRVDVCVPVEIRLLDSDGVQPVTQWMHGVVRNASVGGMRVVVLGEVEKVLAMAESGRQHIELAFVPDVLRTPTPFRAEVRWSREARLGWAVGVRFVDVAVGEAGRLVEVMARFGSAATRRRIWPAVLAAAVFLVLLVWIFSLRGDRQAERGRLDECNAHVAELEEKRSRVRAEAQEEDTGATKLRTCQQDLWKCLLRGGEEGAEPPPLMDPNPEPPVEPEPEEEETGEEAATGEEATDAVPPETESPEPEEEQEPSEGEWEE